MAIATSTASVATMAKGAFPALGDKNGIIEVEIDLATVNAELVAAGDGVLVTGDIIQCLNLPAGTMVVSAGIQITETVVGVAALPVSLGVTGKDPNAWISVVDIGASTSYVLTDYVEMLNDGATGQVMIGAGAAGAATDSIDIVLGTVTATTVTAGKLRVFAIVADCGLLSG